MKEKLCLLSIQLKFENILHVVKLAYFWRTSAELSIKEIIKIRIREDCIDHRGKCIVSTETANYKFAVVHW